MRGEYFSTNGSKLAVSPFSTAAIISASVRSIVGVWAEGGGKVKSGARGHSCPQPRRSPSRAKRRSLVCVRGRLRTRMSARRLRARVVFAVHFAQPAASDVCIDFGGADAGMAEQL